MFSVCYVCGALLDGGGTLCRECSREDIRRRKAALRAQLSALAEARASAAQQRAAIEESPSLLAPLRREQSERLSAAAQRARIAALRAALAAIRAKTAAAQTAVRRRRAFLAAKVSALDAASAQLSAASDAAPAQLSACTASLRARNERLRAELRALRRSAVAELAALLPLGPSPRNPAADTAVVNVALPNSGSYGDVDAAALGAAMGYVLHFVGVLCTLLRLQPPAHWRVCGADSAIWHAADAQQQQQRRRHPLFFERSVEDLRGVQLVNATVAFVAGAVGVDVAPEDERRTLPNLLRIVRHLTQAPPSPLPTAAASASAANRTRSMSMPAGEPPFALLHHK